MNERGLKTGLILKERLTLLKKPVLKLLNACFGDSWENILNCWIEIEEPLRLNLN